MTVRTPKGDDIDTNGVFIDFEDDGSVVTTPMDETDMEDYGWGGFSGPSGFYGSSDPEAAPEPKTGLSDALLGLTWCDPAYSDVLWNHDIRFQAQCAPDIKLAVKQILGVPVGEAPEEKISAFGANLTDSSLLEEIVKYRVDPALMKGAILNPLVTEATLLHTEKQGLKDEKLEAGLQAFELAREVLSGSVSTTETAQTLVQGGNAVALKMLENEKDFDAVLKLLAKKEHTQLRKAYISIAPDPAGLMERYLVDFDLNCELVDLDMLWWLTQQDEDSLVKAMVFPEEIGELGISVAGRTDEEAAWWCAMSHDPQVRALAAHNPALARVMAWASPPPPPVKKKTRSFQMPKKVFDPEAYKMKVASLLMSGVTQEQVSHMLCNGSEELPQEEALDLIRHGDSILITKWLMGMTKVPVTQGAVENVILSLPKDKLSEITSYIKGEQAALLTDYPWSMELFLTLPGVTEEVTKEQAVWARAYIENAISADPNKAEVLEQILETADTWRGSIVELVKSIYPAAKGIPTVTTPEVEEYYD